MTNLTQPTQNLQLTLPKRGMPVTIITGFLGSGKTTLLNHILKNNNRLKVAVLVNEFGDINIDSQLLVSLEEDMMELSNGCICCTINDGLVDAVYRVLERQDRIDYLVIETTGVADPLPIILTFISTELSKLTRLDSVITVVDAGIFTPDHFDSEAALHQIAYGDIILMNKTDLVSAEQVTALENYIQTVKTGARILRCRHSEVPLPMILDVDLIQPDTYPVNQTSVHHHEHEHEHHHHHSAHLENDGFISMSFQSDRPFYVTRFQKFLENLPTTVFRAKGILWFQESPSRHIFQLSGKRYDLQADEWTQTPKNQLVIIGRNLPTDLLQQQLEKCLIH